VSTTRWPPAEYAAAACAEIDHMAEIVRGADLDARVPSCPDWNIAQLVEHTGVIHRWAAQMVRDRMTERLDRSDMDLGLPGEPSGLPGWFAAGSEILAAALARTDPDTPMWAWGADRHARFWSRRMLHETTVHRVDAQLARGEEPAVDAAVAADGIDELLENLPSARYFRPRVAELRGTGETIALRSIDREDSWLIRLVADGFESERAGDTTATATVTITATTEDLLLFMYTRRARTDPRLAIEGDEHVIARWLERAEL
jgi:uncharacterized protein (TIGR03083 family)